jgi:hypothetical protein
MGNSLDVSEQHYRESNIDTGELLSHRSSSYLAEEHPHTTCSLLGEAAHQSGKDDPVPSWLS